MTRCFRVGFLAVLLTAVLPISAAATQDDPGRIEEVTVTFQVQNVNRSEVPCHSDGATYQLTATMVGPAVLLNKEAVPTVVVYVHGLGLASYYWHFQDVPGYDHVTEMARSGHVGLVYDRLGYGDNPKPMGLESCYGSDADVAAQIVEKLKVGDYKTTTSTRPTFKRVVVAAHSQAGLIVQPMAYSFAAADGLVLTSWTDEGNDPAVAAAARETAETCARGGEQSDEHERPPFYAFYPSDEETFRQFYFHNAHPDVVTPAVALRQPDPCGQGGSLLQTLLTDQLRLGEIDAPVLLAYGTHDGYRQQPETGRNHAAKFTGSDDVTVKFLEDTGNALVLERTAPTFRRILSRWLCDRDFAHASACGRRDAGTAPSAPTDPPTGARPPGSAQPAALPATGSTAGGVGVAMSVAGFLCALSLRDRREEPARRDV